MSPSDFLHTHRTLTSAGLHSLAGEFLIRASHEITLPTPSYSIPLDLARKFTLKHPFHITDLLSSGDSRPNLSPSSQVGCLYSLSTDQRDWFRAKYDLTPTQLVTLTWITARLDDPSVVDLACITSLISTSTTRSHLLHSCTFTWAELMSHSSGEDRWCGIPLSRADAAEDLATDRNERVLSPTSRKSTLTSPSRIPLSTSLLAELGL